MPRYLLSPLSILSLSLLFIFNLLGCASMAPSESSISSRELREARVEIEKMTRHAQRYQGFQNVLEINATLLTYSVRQALVDKKAAIYLWDEGEIFEQRNKERQAQFANTQIFLSFFTPNRRHDRLHRGDSLWKVYLEHEGERFEAQIERVRGELSELRAQFPRHNRWSSPYLLSFPIDTSELRNQARLIMTGPVGSVEVDFSPLP